MEGAQSGPKTLKTWELRGKVVVVDMGGKYDVNTVRSFFQSKGAKVLFELKEHADMYVTDMNEREETQSRITRSASLRSRALLSKSNPQVSGDRPKSKTEIEQYLAKYRIMLCYYNRLRPHIERFLNSSSLHSFGHGNRMVCIRDRRSVYNPVIKQYCPSNDENVSSNLSGKKRARTEAPDVPDCFETARKHAKNIKDYSKVSRTPRIRDGPKSGYCELCFKRFDNLTEHVLQPIHMQRHSSLFDQKLLSSIETFISRTKDVELVDWKCLSKDFTKDFLALKAANQLLDNVSMIEEI